MSSVQNKQVLSLRSLYFSLIAGVTLSDVNIWYLSPHDLLHGKDRHLKRKKKKEKRKMSLYSPPVCPPVCLCLHCRHSRNSTIFACFTESPQPSSLLSVSRPSCLSCLLHSQATMILHTSLSYLQKNPGAKQMNVSIASFRLPHF